MSYLGLISIKTRNATTGGSQCYRTTLVILTRNKKQSLTNSRKLLNSELTVKAL